jgi:hypothetical protein
MRFIASLFLIAAAMFAWDYKGQHPEKADVLYLVHAEKLIPLDVAEAKEVGQKKGTGYSVDGASATAKTPLAEPIFLIHSKGLNPDNLSIYPFTVANGKRELFMSKNPKDAIRPIKKTVKKVGDNLYVLEVAQTLAPGEYGWSPDQSNTVFAFKVY